MSKNAKRIRVKVLNPPKDCRDTTSLEHARRYVGRGVAKFIEGALWFLHAAEPGTKASPALEKRLLSEFEPMDAFPGRAVFPPPPGWAESMRGGR